MCSDPTIDWYPQRDICYPTMVEKMAERKYTQIHEKRPYHDGRFKTWAAEPSDATPFHAGDGVNIYVARVDVNPDDHFLTAPSFNDEPEPDEETGRAPSRA